MASKEKKIITVSVIIKAPVETVWNFWTDPKHIICWNYASDDWHTPYAQNDLRAGGKFLSRMEAKDGSFGFDFGGIYEQVLTNQLIVYKIADGRKVKVSFSSTGDETTITEIFEAEQTHSLEMQHTGWQAILENFKNYAEKTAAKLHG
jgi:uncharacterized protein YndB with AHSA1/START domain